MLFAWMVLRLAPLSGVGPGPAMTGRSTTLRRSLTIARDIAELDQKTTIASSRSLRLVRRLPERSATYRVCGTARVSNNPDTAFLVKAGERR
ncbi:hypothetical protein ACV229_10245 [Burkholderia sp. MR1-5-21]